MPIPLISFTPFFASADLVFSDNLKAESSNFLSSTITELFIAWYSGVEYEQYAFLNRATGPYAWAYWMMMSCNVFSPQFMWFKKLRTSIMFSFFISIVVNIGMWFERFVIIVTSLHRDYLPSSWSMFSPTFVDTGIFIGTIGFFFVLFSTC